MARHSPALAFDPGLPLVEVTDLELAYGDHVAVAPSSFTIPQHSVTAIIGPNGSGKSTLLHAMAGIVQPRAGSLRVLGEGADRAFTKAAYVMQTVSVPLGTPIAVREVVTMGRYPSLGWFGRLRRADRKRVAWAMDRLEITDLANRHLSELSGGQRQRVYVAQGIAQDHVVLLLDEPLTGLDLVSARTIDGIIHAEREHDHSVVLTTHDLEEARAADQVILMNGRAIAAGPPEQVLTRRNLEIAYGLGALHDDHQHDVPAALDDHRHEGDGGTGTLPSRHLP